MSILTQLSDSITYAIHSATYNPDAEKFAKERAAESKAAENKKAADLTKANQQQQKEEQVKANAKAAADAAKAEQDKKERAKFNPIRLAGTVFGTLFTIFLVFLIFVGGVLGSSLATNLNVYHSAPYRILYAIYGFLFFFIVIPYVLGYRWFWKGLRPRFYSLIPIIPYHLDNRWAAMLFSWLSYKPDDQVEALKEWQHESKN
jgi:cation transport ATPase